MNNSSNITTVISSQYNAIEVVYRKIFLHNNFPGVIIINDYNGKGSIFLTKYNKMNLLDRKIHWFDLADRVHTQRFYELCFNSHSKEILKRIFNVFTSVANVNISDKIIEWFADLSVKLSKYHDLSIVALLRILAQPNIKNLCKDSKINMRDLNNFQNSILWCLKFPSVYSFFEGVNYFRLVKLFSPKTVIWFENSDTNNEIKENIIICKLMDIIVENEMKNYFVINPDSKIEFTIVHICTPNYLPLNFPEWSLQSSKNIKHINILRLKNSQILSQNYLDWINKSDTIWIVGRIDFGNQLQSCNWLNDDEIQRIKNLEEGKIWIKSNRIGKGITVSQKASTNIEDIHLGRYLNAMSNLKKHITSVRQISSELDSLKVEKKNYMNLYEKLCDIDFLRLGWDRVKLANKNSQGIDRVTIKDFKNTLELELLKLQNELINKTYKCRPLKKVFIEKPDGGERDIGVACIRDRVLLSCCLILLEPYFEPQFSNYSFAFRPRKNPHQAISLIRSRIKMGFEWAIVADIKDCFNTIEHGILKDILEKTIYDEDIIKLIFHWIEIEVLEFKELIPSILGIPLGESLSPLLSNIYLDLLDKHLEYLEICFVRYADDIVIQTKTKKDCENALNVLENFLGDVLQMKLKKEKTKIVNIYEGFEYLGFKIWGNDLLIREKKVNMVNNVIKKYIDEMAKNNNALHKLILLVTKINYTIRGFKNYFFINNESLILNQLEVLDGQIDNYSKIVLPINISDDPIWICRERFSLLMDIEINEIDEKELVTRANSTGHSYPTDNTMANVPLDLIETINDEKKSIILDDDVSNDSNTSTKDSVFEVDRRLFILTHGSYLMNEDDDLIVKRKKKEIYRHKIKELGLVYLEGRGMNISVNLQLKLAEYNIPIVFASSIGSPLAVVNTIVSTKAYLRKLQVTRRDDDDMLKCGMQMLNAKVKNQASLLKYFYKYKKRKESSLIEVNKDIGTIEELAKKILDANTSNEDIRMKVMGYEGHAASIYWQNIKKLVPPKYDFTGRFTRSAKDIINQCFNYVYGILYGEVWRSIVKSGLDPYFGFIHGSQRDGGSMVFDVIEEFRAPFADRIVISLIGRGFIPKVNNTGLLKSYCKKILATTFSKRWHTKIKWHSLDISPAQILDFQAKSITKLLTKEGNYLPFKMKW
ncbi:MAG: CRISPR-associated endonuclease Cas1 [Melioribacteraceae bacterium]|nr:CRISPR-associated endonuclease Cas1 [Melioribacteraceae bacterium]